MDKKLSKKFIEDQEKKLQQERSKIIGQIKELKEGDPFSDPAHVNDNAAIDTDAREQIGHDTIEAEVKDLQRRLEDVELALKKVSKGTYGICDKCHKTIPIPRLELIPEAHFCVECEKKLRK